MRRIFIAALCVTWIDGFGLADSIQAASVSEAEAQAWTRHVVPLPKQMEIVSKVVVPAGEVAIVTSGASDPLIEQGIKELRESLGQAEDGPPPKRPSFTVSLELGGRDAAQLKDRKNAEQACCILPGDRPAELRLIALTPRGLYYATKTLQQLIKAKVSGPTVEMPILRVTDWPDLHDRGLWGSDSFAFSRWLSDRKLNTIEQISSTGVDEQGNTYARLGGGKRMMIEEGPTYGINPVPINVHLEHFGGRRGLFDAHPELKGQGGFEGAICYAKPLFIDILADWIAGLGSLPGVSEVDVWMTENLRGKGGCRCPECRKEDRSVNEIRVILAAWEKAKEKVGDVGLRILTSEETEKSNKLVFAELPDDVKVWYYHSLTTYNSSEVPIVRDYLEAFARAGRQAGICLNLCATVPGAYPFTGADFMHYRMNEFVDKNLSGILGYAVPGINYVRFNVEAAAEWTWNAKGRSTHEFALSWAVREGIADPEKFAQWSDTLGPVAWDVYGSDWPAGEHRRRPPKVAVRLKKGELRGLGIILWGNYESPWGDIKNPQQLEQDVARADRAVELARELGMAEFLQESLVIQGFIHSLEALWELRKIVTPQGVADKNRPAARRYFKMYIDSLNQVVTAMPKWEASLPRRQYSRQRTTMPQREASTSRRQYNRQRTTRPQREASSSRGRSPRLRTDEPIEMINRIIDEMKGLAAELGVDLNAN